MQRLNVVDFETGSAAVGATVTITPEDILAHSRPRLAVNRSVKLRQRYNSVRVPVHPRP